MRLLAAMAIIAAVPLTAGAQQRMNMPAMNMEESKSAAPYHPGLGELMTALVQPRHTKLGLAGAAGNWAYAAYALGELRETFDDVARLVLKHGNLVIGPAIAATVNPALAALDKAIKAKDAAAFETAYGQLTDGCNACHKSADHAMIVIQAPSAAGAAPFPDQNFDPPK
ncbi:MAG TPA: hypothetical protein VFW46_13480 [Stellaceae bacterium]|nr:hypothetical protein [Stellaceae bacterium]